MKCYRQHIHHFKGGFRYVSAQSFNEGEINMETTNDPSDRAGRERTPLPFLENWKKVPRFWGKMP